MGSVFEVLISTVTVPLGNTTYNLPAWSLGLLALITFIVLFVVIPIIQVCVNKHKKHFVLEIVFPQVESKEDMEGFINQVKTVFSSLWELARGGGDKIFFEILKVDKYIKIQVGSNSERILNDARSVLSQIENVKISRAQGDDLSRIKQLFVKEAKTSKDFYPINKDVNFFDGLINHLSSLREEEQAGFQIVISGVNKVGRIESLKNSIDNKAKKEHRALSDVERQKVEMYDEKGEGNLFKVKLYLIASSQSLLSKFSSLMKALNCGENQVVIKSAGREDVLCRYMSPDTIYQLIPFLRNGSYLNSEELAYIIHPSTSVRGRHAPQQTRIIEASPETLEDSPDNIKIGTSLTAEGEKTNVHLPLKNFERHLYLIGKTGRGKSTLIKTLLFDLIKKEDKTIFVFDPHGDLLRDTIEYAPDKERLEYLNIHNQDRVFTFNPIFCFGKSREFKTAVHDALLDVIQRETEDTLGNYQTGVATFNRLKHIIKIGVHFADAYYNYLINNLKIEPGRAKEMVYERQLTLNDLPHILSREHGYLDLLTEVFGDYKDDTGLYVTHKLRSHARQQMVVEAVQTRLEQLLSPPIDLIAEGNRFDVAKIMESNKIFLVPISEATFGSIGARAVMQLLLALTWIIKRQKTENRKDTYFFIDEFQKAQVSSIAEILSEARKYKLYLTFSHQYTGQLRDPIRDAILGNIGTMVTFQTDAENAELIAKQFGEQHVAAKDITRLPNFRAYLRTEGTNRKPIDLYSFETIPVPTLEENTDLVTKKNLEALEEYGEKKEAIEAKKYRKIADPNGYFLKF